jgi:hypothetical protein
MAPTRPNVIIATPCYGGLMSHIYVHSLLKLTGRAVRHGITIGVLTAAHDSLITRSRNALVARFLDNPDGTHLFFVDADIGFQPESVLRLLDLDVEMAAGMYPVKAIDWAKLRAAADLGATGEELRSAGLNFVGVPCTGIDREEQSGFVTGKYAGTGFMMLKRSAVERMVKEYPETRYRAAQTFPKPAVESSNLYNLFDCMIDPETGVYLSEDYTFCHRFRRIGGKVWLDTQSQLRHEGAMEFSGCPDVEMSTSRPSAQQAAAE